VAATGKFLKMPLDAISDADPTALGWHIYPDEITNTEKQQFQKWNADNADLADKSG